MKHNSDNPLFLYSFQISSKNVKKGNPKIKKYIELYEWRDLGFDSDDYKKITGFSKFFL
ncbi:MAG: hypothetical protein ACFE78_13430 [Candidatus Hodarchaeota archaeon]